MNALAEIFTLCRSILGARAWKALAGGRDLATDSFPDYLVQAGGPGIPQYLPWLARLELARFRAAATDVPPHCSDSLQLNPSLQLTTVPWLNLAPLFTRATRRDLARIGRGEEIILTWKQPGDGSVTSRAAGSPDLLAIKLLVEGVDPRTAAAEAGVPVGALDAAMREAVRQGLLLSPPPALRRDGSGASAGTDGEYATAEVFTLQWHLTQQCDLHCRHCYDRSDRSSFPFERAVSLLDELRDFCLRRFIRGQVSLSGGNPLLYPRFLELYRAAAERDLMIAILGNACDRSAVEQVAAIRMPVYYQVSLEGLEEHNDLIRGSGNFRRTVDFLRMLTEMGVPNMVMLTLTRHNLGEVIPLAEELEGITGGMTFNRLALFGEGAALELPTTDEYRNFLEEYSAALDSHPVLALKDSLLNIVFEKEQGRLFGGCAGYGCGAAFNFLSVLPDGEVHACRKFPSPVGNIIADSLETVYACGAAARYRSGSSACAGCSLSHVCRGCPAVTASLGLDPFSQKDPFCFKTP